MILTLQKKLKPAAWRCIMKRYSEDFKKEIIKKLLLPNNKSTKELSEEVGVSVQTILSWRRKYISGRIEQHLPNAMNISNADKLKTLLEAKSLSDEDYGKWLRSKGIYSGQIKLWEEELDNFMKNDFKTMKDENLKLKNENKSLKKDLDKKDKALSEVSALLILKKKANLIWGEEKEN